MLRVGPVLHFQLLRRIDRCSSQRDITLMITLVNLYFTSIMRRDAQFDEEKNVIGGLVVVVVRI